MRWHDSRTTYGRRTGLTLWRRSLSIFSLSLVCQYPCRYIFETDVLLFRARQRLCAGSGSGRYCPRCAVLACGRRAIVRCIEGILSREGEPVPVYGQRVF